MRPLIWNLTLTVERKDVRSVLKTLAPPVVGGIIMVPTEDARVLRCKVLSVDLCGYMFDTTLRDDAWAGDVLAVVVP